MNIRQLYDQGKYKELIKQVRSDDPAELELKAYSFQKLGEFEEAMQVWNRLIQLNNENPSFYNERGVCKFNLRFKHAIDDFNTAVELDPNNPYYISCRAYVKDKLGDTEGAVADYTKAHELDAEDAIILNNLGLAEQKLGHTSNARKFFAKSDDLLGIETIDSMENDEPIAPVKPSWMQKWKEVGKMMSSRKEFRRFLKDAFGR